MGLTFYNSDANADVLTATSAAGSASQTIVVTLTGSSDEPNANDDTGAAFSTDEDQPFTTGKAPANAKDPDATDIVSVSALDADATTGRVMNNGVGTFTYDPSGRFEHLIDGETAADAFRHIIQGNHGRSSAVGVTITITVIWYYTHADGDP